VPFPVRDAEEATQAGARQRIANLVTNAKKAGPRRMLRTVGNESLPDFGK